MNSLKKNYVFIISHWILIIVFILIVIDLISVFLTQGHTPDSSHLCLMYMFAISVYCRLLQLRFFLEKTDKRVVLISKLIFLCKNLL